MKHLKFEDEASALEACKGWLVEGEWPEPSMTLELAVRGPLFRNDAVYDDDQNLVTPPTPIPGFHIDVLSGEIPPELESYLIEPATPCFQLA